MKMSAPARRRWRHHSPVFLLEIVLLLGVFGGLRAQLPSPAERIEALEREVARLNRELVELREEKEPDPEDIFAGGLLLAGGTEFRLGAKAEFVLIVNEDDFFAPLGSDGFTENPDPFIDIQRLRLYPRIDLNRWFSLRGQIDFKPEQGDTRVKELYLRHDTRPVWWFDTRAQLGLDDRFMRPNRRTESYPLAGNTFWRDETVGLIWRMRFGDKDGPPEPEPERRPIMPRGPGTEGFGESVLTRDDGGGGPFDFARNLGEVSIFLSLTQGYTLDDNEIQFDRAPFNDLVQDDRDLDDDLSLREVGAGLEYRRDLETFGDVSLLGFFYDDELRAESIQFLQQDLTLRAPGGAPIAGYGDSNDADSYRYGAQLEYFLPAENLYGDLIETRGNDGLRLLAQFAHGTDGRLEREAWFVQASYRFSFGKLLFDRYFRSLEPVVRFGGLEVNLAPVPQLPGTWDRRELLFGGILEVTGDMFLKLEYVLNMEDTGTRSVDNDVFFVDLVLEL